jgi:hypothetical protein
VSDEGLGTITAVVAWTGDIVHLDRPLDATPANLVKVDERMQAGLIGGYHIRFRDGETP